MRRRPAVSGVDLAVRVGPVGLPNPVMTASGTAGQGAELSAYFDLSLLGAVVVKSLSAEPWAGNPAPRVHETEAGMLNSVGLQNPGVEAWLAGGLPALATTGARVVASIWGTTLAGYEKAAAALAASSTGPGAGPGDRAGDVVVAVEVNLSCPNLEGGRHMFAADPAATRDAVSAVAAACGRPVWAKLSPNVTDIVEIARAARDGGASALTLVNTVKGMAIDPSTRRPRLGAGGGGLSGSAIRPVAVRAVFDVHQAFPDLPLVGVGGVATGEQAVELMLAGASAVQVGTATFEDPRAPLLVVKGLEAWCRRHGVVKVADLVGQAHGAP